MTSYTDNRSKLDKAVDDIRKAIVKSDDNQDANGEKYVTIPKQVLVQLLEGIQQNKKTWMDTLNDVHDSYKEEKENQIRDRIELKKHIFRLSVDLQKEKFGV